MMPCCLSGEKSAPLSPRQGPCFTTRRWRPPLTARTTVYASEFAGCRQASTPVVGQAQGARAAAPRPAHL